GAELELERLVPVAAAVELRAVQEPAGVVDDDDVSMRRRLARALGEVAEPEAGRGRGHGVQVEVEGGGRRGILRTVAAREEDQAEREEDRSSHGIPRFVESSGFSRIRRN